MNLLEVFSTLKDDVKVSCGVSQFLEATTTFQEVVEGIVGDPRPLSLLQKRRGEKGSRELQGDLLRQALEEVIALLVSVPFLVCRYVYMDMHLRYHCGPAFASAIISYIPITRTLFSIWVEPGINVFTCTEINPYQIQVETYLGGGLNLD